MNNGNAKKIALLILVIFLCCYVIIYPIILWLFFSPNPDGVDARQKAMLKSLFITVSLYASDHNGLVPAITKLKSYYPDFPYDEFKLSCLSKLPAENKLPALLVAYSSKPCPRAPNPKEYLCFFNLRLWPTETVKERRYTIFSNGKIEIVEETVFEKFLAQQTKTIKSTEDKPLPSVSVQ